MGISYRYLCNLGKQERPMINKEAIIDTLKDAAEKILNVYYSSSPDVRLKGDGSPVTLADTSSNDVIRGRLSALTPGIPVISEEDSVIPYSERKRFNAVWILDPLDGTREFVSHNGEFCICLALVRDRRPVAGFILAPVTGDLWYAFEGKGSFHEKDRVITRLPLEAPPSTPVVLVSRSHHNSAEREWIEKYVARTGAGVLTLGSALKFCRLAEGRATVYPKFGAINEWDVAAGDIILKEAGGSITETVSGKEPVYNKESLVQPYFVARSKGYTI